MSRRCGDDLGFRSAWPGRLAALLGLSMALLAVGCVASEPRTGPRQSRLDPPELVRIRAYIRRGWDELTRSHRTVLRSFETPAGRRPAVMYVSRRESREAVLRRLRDVAGVDARHVQVRTLPPVLADLTEHGLLYLPHPYVVPGGRFVEMYGWDSHFIQLGLLEDGRHDLARSLVDNFIYEVEHYGFVLNANRTYFLTRSQPPFLTRMILAVATRVRDQTWLARATAAAVAYHGFWARDAAPLPARQDAGTGLARYYDDGRGPAPEVATDRDARTGETHYDRVRAYYRSHPDADLGYARERFYDAAQDRLTETFYVGDRAMRESGYDPSDRFGRFSVDIPSYLPVELNALLYVMEEDLHALHLRLDRPVEAARWRARARQRAARVQQLLWDPGEGLFLDWHVGRGRRSRYPFVTTFFPLWAGLATPEQARRVVCNLPRFETPGGLQASPFVTGSQWDAPYVWAPLQVIAVEGLRRYGYHAEANRLSRRFLSMALTDFERTGTIVEKYDGRTRSSRVSLTYGYTTQEIGFGWTNAAFLVLLRGLPPADRSRLRVPLPSPGGARPGCPPLAPTPATPTW